ncbi:hypothetical protein ACSQ67_010057 [Phaseolus vulgaris]
MHAGYQPKHALDSVSEVSALMLPALLGLELSHFCNYEDYNWRGDFWKVIRHGYDVILEVYEATHTWKFVYVVEFAFRRTQCMLVTNPSMLWIQLGEVSGLMLPTLLGLELWHFCNYVFVLVH